MLIERDAFSGSNLNPVSSVHSESEKYVDYIEQIHPNYIRELFHDTQNIKEDKASYEELVVMMNEKSSIPSDIRCILLLRKLQLY